METIKVSFLKKITNKQSHPVDLMEFLKSMHEDPEIRAAVALIRKQKTHEEQKKLKVIHLAAYTTEVLFNSEGITDKNVIQEYAQLKIDIDGPDNPIIQEQGIDVAKKILIESVGPYLLHLCISPSGKGLHGIIAVKDIEHKQEYRNAITEHIKSTTGLNLDANVDTRSQKLFVTSDPQYYINEQYVPWDKVLEAKQTEEHENFPGDGKSLLTDDEYLEVIKTCEQSLLKKGVCFEENKRHSFVKRIAPFCNKHGVPRDILIRYMDEKYQLNSFEKHRDTIYQMYLKYADQFATKRFKFKKSVASALQLIEDSLSKIAEFRHNEVLQQIEFRYHSEVDAEFKVIEDRDQNNLFRILRKENIPCNQRMLDTILNSDYSTPYNPIIEHFESLTWDGKDHIAELAKTIVTPNQEFFMRALKKFLIGVIFSAIRCESNDIVLVLQGRQGIGKTRWLYKLVPTPLLRYYYSGIIDPANKDHQLNLSFCLFINIDELETMRGGDINKMKEFITKPVINVRLPYGKRPVRLERRASLMASVNQGEFLTDSTGNRRFLCFAVEEMDYEHNVSIDQVYAQAYQAFINGEKHYFSSEEVMEINKNNQQFQSISNEEYYISKYFAKVDGLTNANRIIHLSAQDIINVIQNGENGKNLPVLHSSSIGKILTAKGFKKRQHGKAKITKYEVVEVVESELHDENEWQFSDKFNIVFSSDYDIFNIPIEWAITPSEIKYSLIDPELPPSDDYSTWVHLNE